MVQVLVSREFDTGLVAVAIFLVDTWCLGVKDAFARIMPRGDYADNVYTPLRERFPLRHVSPACARKFVEDAVAWARGLGLEPHVGYRKAAPIFGDADPADCPREFEFGDNGRPHFVSGPGDTAEKCWRIMAHLRQRLGEDGFECTLHLTEAQARRLGIAIDDDEFIDDEDWYDEDDEPRSPDEDE